MKNCWLSAQNVTQNKLRLKMIDLFNQPTGKQLKEDGIKRAVDHADRQIETWSERAYKLFVEYCQTVDTLKAEDARVYAEEKGLEIPPTKRAWGAIALKAAKNGCIINKGIVKASNVKCHQGFTTLWEVVKDKIIQP